MLKMICRLIALTVVALPLVAQNLEIKVGHDATIVTTDKGTSVTEKNGLPYSAAAVKSMLARISHTIECIGATNQRKLLCHNDLTPTRGEPRCGQSVRRISLDSHPLKDAM